MRNILSYIITISIILSVTGAVHARGIEGSEIGLDEEFYSTKKTIRVTDGIGKGRTREIAMQNAIIDARKKALKRVTSTFRHMLSEAKDGVFVSESVAEEVHARIIDKEKIRNVTYDHGIDFGSTQVAMVDADITVSFLDLDFFAQEMMKTAEAACIRSLVLSGWGQVFNRNYFGGISMGLITYGSIGYGYHRETQIDAARKAYNGAKTPVEAERAYKTYRDHQQTARTMYVIGAMTWAYSVWDAFEDRERADEVLDQVHKAYFPKFPYQRRISPIQRFVMENMRPEW